MDSKHPQNGIAALGRGRPSALLIQPAAYEVTVENLDLFPELLPGASYAGDRARPRVLMHVTDTTLMPDGRHACVMVCKRCRSRTGWLPFSSLSKAKRGVPCEACNSSVSRRG